MKRRDFLRNSVIISGGTLISPSIYSFAQKTKGTRITILHTNDTHSNIDSFPANHSKYPNLGGVASRFQLVNQIRTEEKNVLLLDAGDIFQGTPYFNKFGGILEMKLMSKLGYDAATMGNHDFDGGMNGFVKAKQYADFPFLCSNYDFQNTPIDGITQPHTIFQKEGIKIGVFGVGVKLKGLVPDELFGETKYLDPIEVANDQARILKEKGCDLIICLSHLGYSYQTEQVSDVQLAQKTENIHLIIGGHTHTFLEKPTETKNRKGETVLVNQVGWAGVNLGRVDFHFESNRVRKRGVSLEVR